MATRFKLCLGVLASGTVMAGAWPAGQAAAQGFRAADTQRGVTVLTRPRPDYDPLGVRLGAFQFNGAVDIGPGYDSNLFGNKRNSRSDGFVDENVNLSLNSLWSTHAVGVSANMDSRQYFRTSALDWQDFDVGGFGRYDFSSVTSIEGSYRHYRDHLDVTNFDVQQAGFATPVPFTSDEVQATAQTRLNRIGLLGTGLFRTYRFEDTVTNGVRNQVSTQDFNTAIGAFGTTYALAEGRFITGVFRIQDISYTNSISRDRDSFTWEALVGFQYDFDGVWQGRIAFGWRQRDYRGSRLKTLEGPAIEGNLTWAPTQLTTVRLNVLRTIEESIRNDAVSFQRTQGGLAVDHELLRNVILGADVRIDRREYDSPNQTAMDALFTVSGRYLINRNMSVLGSYTYSRRIEASGGLPEFDRNLLQVRLRFAI